MYIERKSVKGPRIGAALIDWIFFSIVSGIITIPVQIFAPGGGSNSLFGSFAYSNQSDIDPTAIVVGLLISFVTSLVVVLFYYTFIPYFTKGMTLGKMIVGVKIVSSDFKRPSLIQLILRNIFFLTSLIIGGVSLILTYIMMTNENVAMVFGILLLSLVNYIIYIIIFIMILATPEERGFHDMIAGTYVVSKDFDLDDLNNANILERQGMEWAEFDDDLDLKKEEDEIGILGNKDDQNANDDDQIDLLKNDPE